MFETRDVMKTTEKLWTFTGEMWVSLFLEAHKRKRKEGI